MSQARDLSAEFFDAVMRGGAQQAAAIQAVNDYTRQHLRPMASAQLAAQLPLNHSAPTHAGVPMDPDVVFGTPPSPDIARVVAADAGDYALSGAVLRNDGWTSGGNVIAASEPSLREILEQEGLQISDLIEAIRYVKEQRTLAAQTGRPARARRLTLGD